MKTKVEVIVGGVGMLGSTALMLHPHCWWLPGILCVITFLVSLSLTQVKSCE
jgi:hypothetical protein